MDNSVDTNSYSFDMEELTDLFPLYLEEDKESSETLAMEEFRLDMEELKDLFPLDLEEDKENNATFAMEESKDPFSSDLAEVKESNGTSAMGNYMDTSSCTEELKDIFPFNLEEEKIINESLALNNFVDTNSYSCDTREEHSDPFTLNLEEDKKSSGTLTFHIFLYKEYMCTKLRTYSKLALTEELIKRCELRTAELQRNSDLEAIDELMETLVHLQSLKNYRTELLKLIYSPNKKNTEEVSVLPKSPKRKMSEGCENDSERKNKYPKLE